MSPRTGRPTDKPKQHRESFRLSDEDMRKLNECTEKLSSTKTDVVRTGIDMVYKTIKK